MHSHTDNSKIKRRGRVRILLLVFLFIVISAAVTGYLFWNRQKNVIIENKIEKAISKNNDGLYRISYDEMKVDETAGSLFVTNMKLTYDTAKYLLNQKEGKTPSMLFEINIPEISVVGVKTKKALLDKEVVGRKLEIRNPVVNLLYTYKGKDPERNVPTEEIYKEVLGNLDMIQIDSVVITGAQVITKNQKTGKLLIDVKDINLSLVDVKVDSTAYLDSSRFLFAKQMELRVAKIEWPSPNRLYDYRVENVLLRSRSNNLSVGKVLLRPRLGENEFVNAIPTQQDRYDFAINNVVFNGIDIHSLFDEYVRAAGMTIGSSSFKIYRDLARPRDQKNRVGHYPHQVMDDIPLRFKIEKINVRNSFVEYKERNHITRQSGKVQFYAVNGTITNFTNDKRVSNNLMRASINSSFLNKTPLETNWTFYLFHPQGRFNVSGSMGAIDGQTLNSLTEPMGPASIEEGHMNGITFNLHGDDHSMNGNVKMLYENLDVALLEKDKGASETDKKFLTSLIANLVIKNSNPNGNDEVRVQQVHVLRNTNRSLFNLCWKTMFQGIRQTIGIKQPLAVK